MQDTCKNYPNTANNPIYKEEKAESNDNSVKSCRTNDRCATLECDTKERVSVSNRIRTGAESRVRQFQRMTYITFAILILGLAFIAFTTYSALMSSKTATGTIAFTFKSPAMVFDSGIKMYYATVDEYGYAEPNKITFGDANKATTETTGTYNVAIDSQNQLSSYYIKIEYVFQGLSSTTNLINFDTTTYKMGTVSLGSIQRDSTAKNKFTLASATKVNKGVSFNLLEPLTHFSYSGTNFTTTTAQTIYIIVSADTQQVMSDSRTQATVNGQIGFRVGTATNEVPCVDTKVFDGCIVSSSNINYSTVPNDNYFMSESFGKYVRFVFQCQYVLFPDEEYYDFEYYKKSDTEWTCFGGLYVALSCSSSGGTKIFAYIENVKGENYLAEDLLMDVFADDLVSNPSSSDFMLDVTFEYSVDNGATFRPMVDYTTGAVATAQIRFKK